MNKVYVLLLFISFNSLYAQELLSILKSVQNNHTLHMTHVQQPFVCKPYGVETLSELVARTDTNSSCMQSLKNFRLENPEEQYFAVLSLKIQQQYSVESKQGLCLLHLSSEDSYSESLLEHGYALIITEGIKNDKVLEDRFEKALMRAKQDKAGIWSDAKARKCFLHSNK